MNAAVWESSADPTGTVWFSVVTDSSSVPEATDETLWEPQSSTLSFTLMKEQELINEDADTEHSQRDYFKEDH